MNQELHELEFHYENTLIGIGYNLTEKEADKLWEEWENFDVGCWCMIVYRVEFEE